MNSCFIDRDSPLILASKSPRRRRLLEQVGLPFLSVASHIEENDSRGGPLATVCRLAARKAVAVESGVRGRWVLGADTLVVLGEEILGKPGDADQAGTMLRLLSGKEHRVLTGFSVLNPEREVAHTEAVTTFVKVKDLSEEEIAGYVATGEPFGKAGSYAIQGVGAFMVEGISGSYTNVVGLPVYAVIRSLLALGALERFPLAP